MLHKYVAQKFLKENTKHFFMFHIELPFQWFCIKIKDKKTCHENMMYLHSKTMSKTTFSLNFS